MDNGQNTAWRLCKVLKIQNHHKERCVRFDQSSEEVLPSLSWVSFVSRGIEF